LKYGGQYIYHIYTTSTVEVNSGDTQFNIETPPKLHAHEGALYVMDDFDVTENFRINAGLRFTTFHHVGPFMLYQLDDQGWTSGKVEYKPGKPISSYSALEPRLSMRYITGKNSSVKVFFN